jgi:hypothetical protein
MSVAGVVFKRVRGRIIPIRQAAAGALKAVAQKTNLNMSHKVAQSARIAAQAEYNVAKSAVKTRSVLYGWDKTVGRSAAGVNHLMSAYGKGATNMSRLQKVNAIRAKIPKIQTRNRIAAGIAGATLVTAGGAYGATAFSNRKKK